MEPGNYRKPGSSLFYDKIFGESLLMVEGKEWKRQREMLHESFKFENLVNSNFMMFHKIIKEALD